MEFGGDTYHIDTRGQWSTVFQVPENMSGPQEVKASCGWTYATSTIEVVADGAEGLDPRGVLLVTDAGVSVGRYFNVYGAGCSAGSTIELTFGSQPRRSRNVGARPGRAARSRPRPPTLASRR